MDVDYHEWEVGAYANSRRVAAGEIDILLGTQIIAKGLDFRTSRWSDGDADVGIIFPDFRAVGALVPTHRAGRRGARDVARRVGQ